MKKNFKTVIILVAVACALVASVFFHEEKVVETVPDEPKKAASIVLSMDIETERPFMSQIFWIENDSENFNEKQSVRQQVEQGATRYEKEIPTDIVHRIRFDFGSNPGKVVVKNIRLSGANPVDLDVNEFMPFSKDIQSHEVVNGALIIVSEQRDPYMIYPHDLDVIKENVNN